MTNSEHLEIIEFIEEMQNILDNETFIDFMNWIPRNNKPYNYESLKEFGITI